MEKLLEFFTEIGKMKEKQRLGWVAEGVKNPESVADHSFRMAMMILVLGKQRKDIDINKSMKMALVHDLAESQTGDILVDWKLHHLGENVKRLEGKGVYGVTPGEKIQMEKDGINKLFMLIEDEKEIQNLWDEYSERKTKEAVFVKSVDILEMFLQAFEYEKTQLTIDISNWFNHPNNFVSVKDSQIKEILNFLIEKRRLYRSKN